MPDASRGVIGTPAEATKGNPQIGDLVFYYGPTPSHVGIYAGGGKIIHTPRPGKVVQHVPIDYMPFAGRPTGLTGAAGTHWNRCRSCDQRRFRRPSGPHD